MECDRLEALAMQSGVPVGPREAFGLFLARGFPHRIRVPVRRYGHKGLSLPTSIPPAFAWRIVSPGSPEANRRPRSLRCLRFSGPLPNRSKVDFLRLAIVILLLFEIDPGSARLAKELQTLQRGRARPFSQAARPPPKYRR